MVRSNTRFEYKKCKIALTILSLIFLFSFNSGDYCSTSCYCKNCENTANHEPSRRAAVQSIFVRNIQSMLEENGDVVNSKRCKCAKSHCLKKYCVCFNAGEHCSDRCLCKECKNKPESMLLANAKQKQLFAFKKAGQDEDVYTASSTNTQASYEEVYTIDTKNLCRICSGQNIVSIFNPKPTNRLIKF